MTDEQAMHGENWKSVAGYEGYYRVSSIGRVHRMRGFDYKKGRPRFSYGYPNKDGYYSVQLCMTGVKRKTVAVHRLVADAFIENPDGLPEINHINSIRTDNRVENLEWCTKRQNAIHGIVYGNRATKLNPAKVRVIRRCVEQGMTRRSVASVFGVGETMIQNVAIGKRWSHVSSDQPLATYHALAWLKGKK